MGLFTQLNITTPTPGRPLFHCWCSQHRRTSCITDRFHGCSNSSRPSLFLVFLAHVSCVLAFVLLQARVDLSHLLLSDSPSSHPSDSVLPVAKQLQVHRPWYVVSSCSPPPPFRLPNLQPQPQPMWHGQSRTFEEHHATFACSVRVSKYPLDLAPLPPLQHTHTQHMRSHLHQSLVLFSADPIPISCPALQCFILAMKCPQTRRFSLQLYVVGASTKRINHQHYCHHHNRNHHHAWC